MQPLHPLEGLCAAPPRLAVMPGRRSAQHCTEQHMDGQVVWDGTESPASPHGVAVRAWLEANGIDAKYVPAYSQVIVAHGEIRYISYEANAEGKIMVNPDAVHTGEPQIVGRTAPIKVAWPLGQPA